MRCCSRSLRFVVLSFLSLSVSRCGGGDAKDAAWEGGQGSADDGGVPAGSGQETLLFKMESVEGVSANPPNLTIFTLAKTSYITRVWTYHDSAVIGSKSPTVAFKDTTSGQLFGPWPQVGYRTFNGNLGVTADDPGNIPGPPDNYWMAYPGTTVPAGTYQVIDSDPGTWSYTRDLGLRGVTWVYGWAGGPVPGRDAGSSGSEAGGLHRLDGGIEVRAIDAGTEALAVDAANDGPVTTIGYTATVNPSGQATTVPVGPGVTITVPGGLFAQPATFTVSRMTALPAPIESPNQQLDAWSVTCDLGSTFAQELTLEFAYDPAALDPGLPEGKGIFLAYWDESALGWMPVPAKVDTATKRLQVKTSHLSTWVYWTLRGYKTVASSNGHFDVYYDPAATSPLTSPAMSIANFASHAGEIMEEAWAAYDGAGFTMPRAWFSCPLSMVITDDMRWVWNTFKLAGYNPLYENPNESSPMYSALSGNIFLKRSMLTSDEVIRADGAHELFHAVQNRYATVRTIANNLWWYEGTADYAAFDVAWKRATPLDEFLMPMPADYFQDPLTEAVDTHAYQMAVFLDYLHGQHSIQFKPLWDAVEQASNPLTGFSDYVTQNAAHTFDTIWASYLDQMYFAPPFTYTPVSSAVQLSSLKTSASATWAVAGGYSARSLLVKVKLDVTQASASPVISTTADLPANVAVEIWYAPGGATNTAKLKQVMTGGTRASTPVSLANGDVLYALVRNTGTAAANVKLTASIPEPQTGDCRFSKGDATGVTLDLATVKCTDSDSLSLCFALADGGSVTKSAEPGCDGFIDAYELTGSYTCNTVNLTYSFLDSSSADYPGCSASTTVSRDIVYDGTVSLVWDKASSAFTVSSSAGTFQSNYTSKDCSVKFPTCSASDLRVTAAR
jgi:hypothetical protein